MEEEGDGSPSRPFRLALRQEPNASGCVHCPTTTCHCLYMSRLLAECYESLPLKRIALQGRRRELCAKSMLPTFVSRLLRFADVKGDSETFYDFGCGNGSFLFQVAFATGARCVGVELDAHNAAVAAAAWEKLRPALETAGKRPLSVTIIHDDFCRWIASHREELAAAPCVVWAANSLLESSTNQFLSDSFQEVKEGSRIFSIEDLYPHSRSVARVRHPATFEHFLFADLCWQEGSVEWSCKEGRFYMYERV